jgi:hypothetical protein
MMHIQDTCSDGIHPCWRVTEIGQGLVTPRPGALHLIDQPAPTRTYHNAQISDYARGKDFKWHPPLRMIVRGYAPDPVRGTAGFGFWNQPFAPGETRVRLPKAVWFFFSSPPSDMRLARGVPGPGWKAATFDAAHWRFLALLPAVPLAFLLMRIPAVYNRLWPVGQHIIGVSEHLLESALLAESHIYQIDWLPDHVTFTVDGTIIHRADIAIRGPLGFIAWVDNQYAVVTPQGRFRFGLIPVEREQSLVLEYVELSSP